MARHGCPNSDPQPHRSSRRLYWPLAGVLALAWLLVRSGPKPGRLAYPCQQAAFSTAALVFGASIVGSAVAVRRRLSARWLTPVGLALGMAALIAVAGPWSQMNRTAAYVGPQHAPRADYRAQVFSQIDCPQNPLGDRFICVEDLIEKMGAQGIKFHRSSTTSLTAGLDGIIAADDVVLIKFNYQWPERGGTNTDLLRGLVRRIVDHPDTFTGEIVLLENTQFAASDGFDRSQNNAQDQGLSPHDIVVHFQALGYRISHVDLRAMRFTAVQEYTRGDMNDGYVVNPYDPVLNGKVSYPKFQTSYGTRISVAGGTWEEATGYDRQGLKFINVPVLKSHHATYGATAMVKNYMGVVTGELSTNSHSAIQNGILGALLGVMQPADLNILDAIWINAHPNDGPWTSYAAATRMDRLVASVDPVAADLWAVKNILIPGFLANGYTPPWPYPSADPDDPTSQFRQYLDHSMNYLLAAGYDATNDLSQVDAIELGPPGEVSDPTGSWYPLTLAKDPGGFALGWSAPFRGGVVEEYMLYRVSLAGLAGGAAPECEAALGTDTSAVVATLPDNHGFLVVARNAVGDGSFGRDSHGHDRSSPALADVCP